MSSVWVSANQTADPKAMAKQSLAIRAAAQEVLLLLETQDALPDNVPGQLSEPLAGYMVDHLKDFAQKKQGKQKAEDWLRTWRINAFNEAVETIVDQNAAQSPLPMDESTVLLRADPQWQKRRDDGANAFASRHIDAVYPAARKRAVSLQLSQWKTSQAYPEQDTLDPELLRIDKQRNRQPSPLKQDTFNALDGWLKQWVKVPSPLFEELKHTQGEMVGSLRDEVTRQYLHQVDTLRPMLIEGRFPPHTLTAPELEQQMQQTLDAAIQPAPATSPPTYGPFAAMTSLVHDAAAHWEAARMKTFLSERKEWKPTAAAIETLMDADPKRYVDPGQSLDLLQNHVANDQRDTVVHLYSASLPEADRARVQDYFLQALKRNDGSGNMWNQLVRDALNQLLPPLRQARMEKQYDKHFKPLYAPARLPEELVVWMHEQGKQNAESLPDLMSAWRAVNPSHLTSLTQQELLHETRDRALKELNDRLPPQLTSLTKQLALVQKMDREDRHDLELAVRDGKSVKDILHQWTQNWGEAWERQVKKEPALDITMYARTRDQLDKTVRQLFETVEQAAASGTPAFASADPDNLESDQPASADMTQVENPDEKTGEQLEQEENPQGDGAGEQEDAGMTDALRAYRGRADGVLSFRDLPSGKCQLVFGSPTGQDRTTVEFDPENVDESARTIADAMSIPLRQVLDGAPPRGMAGLRLFNRSTNPELRMLFRVDSPAIRHQMSIQVRELIDEQITAWSESSGKPAPTLLWQDEVARD